MISLERLPALLLLGGMVTTVVVGTVRFGLRLHGVERNLRTRLLAWAAVPALVGGLCASLDGPREGEFGGFLILVGVLGLGSWVAIGLYLPRQIRVFTRTLLFEGLALLAWGFALVAVLKSVGQTAG
jgi:hypothetical protein